MEFSTKHNPCKCLNKFKTCQKTQKLCGSLDTELNVELTNTLIFNPVTSVFTVVLPKMTNST